MKHPQVSICIPAYNQPGVLRRCLESVALQQYRDYEVVVTDDSDNYAVQAIADEFSSLINLRYYRNLHRAGTPKNWNLAIGLATGSYIKVMHHDDWFVNQDSLSKFVSMLEEHPGRNFAFSASVVCNATQQPQYTHTPSKRQLRALQQSPECLFFGNFIGAPSATIFRRSATTTFDENLQWLVDIDFYITVLNDRQSFVYLDEPLVYVTGEALHQVTRACENNERVELFEFFYLYNKLPQRKIGWSRYGKFFWDLLRKYRVRSLSQIESYMPKIAIPAMIPRIITLQKFIPAIPRGKMSFC